MSILINGMEMPECCGYCPFEYKNYCMAKPSLRVESADRHPDCPLISVPPHGRCVDADELKTAFPCGESVRTECVRATIDHAQTIIPADEVV